MSFVPGFMFTHMLSGPEAAVRNAPALRVSIPGARDFPAGASDFPAMGRCWGRASSSFREDVKRQRTARAGPAATTAGFHPTELDGPRIRAPAHGRFPGGGRGVRARADIGFM